MSDIKQLSSNSATLIAGVAIFLTGSKSCPRCGCIHCRSHKYCKQCHAGYMRKWRKSHPLTPKQRFRDNARSYAGTYKRRGKLTEKACEVCGDKNAEMHHGDYRYPLKVRWLCRKDHLALHRNQQDVERGTLNYMKKGSQ